MKKNLLKFEAQNKTIEETIFGPKYLKIPDYQRAYSWNKDKAEEFWNDLLENDN